MDKIEYVCASLIELRDTIEDLLDELIPPPAEETVESALSEAPPERGVAPSQGARRLTYRATVRKTT